MPPSHRGRIYPASTGIGTDNHRVVMGRIAQTTETLDNIASLISERNLARHGLPGLGTTLDGLAFARVYIKHPQDYARVRAICEARLGELPVIYAVADVCRDDLLVEIEGIACANHA